MLKIFFFIFLLCFGCNSDKIDSSEIISGDILVLNGAENSISVIDPNSFLEKSRIYLKTNSSVFSHHLSLYSNRNFLCTSMSEYDFSRGHENIHGKTYKGGLGVFSVKTGQLSQFKEIANANHNVLYSEMANEYWAATVNHSAKILIYDVSSLELKNEISVGPDPADIIFVNKGLQAIISSSETSFLAVVDVASKKIIKEVKVDPYPTGLYFDDVQNLAILTNANKKSINMVDLQNYKVMDFIDLKFEPGFAIFRKENEIWITEPTQNKIHILIKNSSLWEEKWVMNTETDPHQIIFENNMAIICNQGSNSLQVIDVENKELIKTVKTGLKPNSIAIWK